MTPKLKDYWKASQSWLHTIKTSGWSVIGCNKTLFLCLLMHLMHKYAYAYLICISHASYASHVVWLCMRCISRTISFCLGVHLQLTSYKLCPQFFPRRRGARAPSAPLATPTPQKGKEDDMWQKGGSSRSPTSVRHACTKAEVIKQT